MSQRFFNVDEALHSKLLASRIEQARAIPMCPNAELLGLAYGRTSSSDREAEYLEDIQLAPGVFAVVSHDCTCRSPLR